jgi:GNAT superfamily N-acetyltransferase
VAAVDPPVEDTLPDGARVRFRAITADDKDRLRRGFEQLSEASRYRRFFYAIEELSDTQVKYLTELDYVNHYAWLAVQPDVDGEPAVGVARWVRSEEDAEAAEAAITVVDSWQSRGLGRRLLQLLARSAVERGIRRFTAEVLGENTSMLHLFRELGGDIASREGGIVYVVAPLPERVEDLDTTAVGTILRAVAAGRLEGHSQPTGVTRFGRLKGEKPETP